MEKLETKRLKVALQCEKRIIEDNLNEVRSGDVSMLSLLSIEKLLKEQNILQQRMIDLLEKQISKLDEVAKRHQKLQMIRIPQQPELEPEPEPTKRTGLLQKIFR